MSGPSCEYCGRCLSVCPSYKHHLVETMGPRARIDLARAVAAGELAPGERYFSAIKSCMQCLACTETCGKGVDGARIILDARNAIGDGKMTAGRRLEKLATSMLVSNRKLTARTVRICSILQKIFRRDACGTVRHLPDVLNGLAGKRSLPNLAPKSLFDILPERISPDDSVDYSGDVALFTGCFGGLVNVDASLRLVEALTSRGYAVYLPSAQTCCGAPAQLSGFSKAFAMAQIRNAEVFAECGDMPVLTMCATCNRTLGREFLPEGKSLAKRIIDSSVFLRRHDERTRRRTGMPSILPKAVVHARKGRPVSEGDPLVVAVHDPCHFRLNPDAGKSVRTLLHAKPWIRLVELADPGSCCGGGGISSLKNPEIADELGEARAKSVIRSGADVVVAQCPGCVLQLNNHLLRLDNRVRACHALELGC